MMMYDENDSLAFDREPPEVFIPSCPWMSVVKHSIGFESPFDLPSKSFMKSREVNFVGENGDENQAPGEDFTKLCSFRYIPNKLFNINIVYENEQ
ncbi:hypothetical protein TVAG_320810 [Trichomonas vaginalis G3]|uniref:Uncharacterized protein n=1 Tax=Trichomonas vaginalis (strain ATCC PRA-98 / G3) TaxID=412133 RepID=A2G9P7_TRIV3|nr:hypothetical protein TVAGG3_0167910 [Trichomonas vaginalis G3]EAX86120.1 hypothetical protein TVAG_320810 [Trichomonas vaginalis G3]KAI5548374.1 hypothetical protein TVAGG3_0167910 [Trichomonas vaginalis G3]|eukprot:XP_001299050.1 hypothetical protein [Trichomonas vaginalis G3]